MSKFPKAPPLDWAVVQSRLLRRKALLLTARRGVLLRGVIIVLELFWVFCWGSSALFLDALSCFMDVIATLVLMWCIQKADTPPDAEHPLGHGRFEPIAGLLIGFLLIFLGLLSGFEQVKGLFTDNRGGEIQSFAWVIPLLAVVILEMCHQSLKKVAKQKNSPALLADAVHYRIDALTSFFALAALSFAAIFPSVSLLFDHIGAILIALFMVIVGLIAARKNIHQLIDHSPSKEAFQKVQVAALSVQGVLETEKIRIQTYGPDAHVSIDIEVDPHLSVALSHEITQLVRRAIQKTWPAVRDVIVHVEPYYPGDHET